MSLKKFAMIAACCENNGIGVKNGLPWKLKKEMAYFTRLTTRTEDPNKQNAVIVGRKTFESIPPKYRPLPNRINVVISRAMQEKPNGAHFMFQDLDEALKFLSNNEQVEKIFVAGGEMIYRICMNHEACEGIYLTRIYKNFECDTFFPDIDPNVYKLEKHEDVPSIKEEENGIEYEYFYFKRN